MRYFLPLVISLFASFSAVNLTYASFKEIPIKAEWWTCSGCWTTNSDEATQCYKCGRSR
ncbi:MAG: hypothetical protein AB7N99_06545 [Simkaniaceae bacterium]|jgi:hypothetical protein